MEHELACGVARTVVGDVRLDLLDEAVGHDVAGRVEDEGDLVDDDPVDGRQPRGGLERQRTA
jgi:hypothetical protein